MQRAITASRVLRSAFLSSFKNNLRSSMNDPIDTLFQPLMIGGATVKTRLALSSMSRHRSTLAGVPPVPNVEFYRQRAGAGLVLGEGTYPSPMGKAYLFTPGLYDEAQL